MNQSIDLDAFGVSAVIGQQQSIRTITIAATEMIFSQSQSLDGDGRELSGLAWSEPTVAVVVVRTRSGDRWLCLSGQGGIL
jgi:hypothetical protein